MTHRVNPKELGFNKKSITSKSSSYINKKGELIKIKDYSTVYDPEQMTQIEELSLYKDKFDKDEERKHGRSNSKIKRCKCKKRK